MGKLNKGILGHFTGKVGTVVGSTWRGVEYMRSKQGKSKRAATEKQLDQQAKFSLVVKFIKALNSLVRISFNDPSKDMTGSNAALSFNIINAITGAYPAYMIDYSRAAVSEGVLHGAPGGSAIAGGSGIIKFTWSPTSGANANSDDTCVGVAYCPELKQAVYTTTGGAMRSTGNDDLSAALFTGKTVETWLFFTSYDGTKVSSSTYTGQVVVS
ncbi:MAG TPA: DUF6266 family protein [Ferruginibacter sp.]|nr:DUF6266 family protein [Ferruginibacter sp.]